MLCWTILQSVNTSAQSPLLPVGSHPEALPAVHFPDRLHAFVWRNWNLVSPEVMAETISCKPEDILSVAASMGLPEYIPAPPSFNKRIYITVIRRNWHLLPYNQLLKLLNMTGEELSLALKEDDFLFIKLGSLKPRVAELHYRSPDAAVKRRAAEIKSLSGAYFRKAAGVPRFQFIDDLTATSSQPLFKPDSNTNHNEQPRIVYSYFGIFGDPLSDSSQNPYPDGLLEKLAAHGVNGIWMHSVLNQLAPGSPDFPEFGQGQATRIANLKKAVSRARKFGIGIYLYVNEPRAMPDSFFTNRHPMRGTKEGDYYAMCTSDKRVTHWISNALEYIFKEVPDLAGVLTITASENFTSCASHGNQAACTRCSGRNYADIIAEVNQAIEAGVHRGNPKAKVVVWDWGWYSHGLAQDIIQLLPKNVYLMSVSEWAKPISRGGVESKVGEYSLSAVGPGPRATQHWAWAKEAGLKTLAKVQVNNSWELSAVPWLPVFELVKRHMSALAASRTDGLMLSWTLGGYPSPNISIADHYIKNSTENLDFLDEIAQKRYGTAAIPAARKAWKAFSDAFEDYPYSGSTLYTAPQQFGPANLLFEQPTGYSATMVGFPYDDLTSWRGVYPDTVFIRQFQKLAKGWLSGLALLEQATPLTVGNHRTALLTDLNIAKAAYLHFASVANQAVFVKYRNALAKTNITPTERKKYVEQIRSVLTDEIQLAGELLAVCRKDSRIGYEASNQYYYVEQDLVEKIINCRYLLARFDDRRTR